MFRQGSCRNMTIPLRAAASGKMQNISWFGVLYTQYNVRVFLGRQPLLCPFAMKESACNLVGLQYN